MIKHLILNKRKIPVPVPVTGLREALVWIESYLLTGDKVITKVELDGRLVESVSSEGPALDADSKLVVQADSPLDLSVQTIDSLQNMTGMLLKDIKHCAVQCWQAKPKEKPKYLDTWLEDFGLMVDLLDHLMILLESRAEIANIDNCFEEMSKTRVAMDMAIRNSDWRGLARVMLQKMEKNIIELANELASIQRLIFEVQAENLQTARRAGQA